MRNPFASIGEEARGFRAALEAAPEPELGWDVVGARRLMHKLFWLLIREHTEPASLGFAVFVGVLIGSSPFYLFHTGLVLLAAFALRLNKLAVWIASNVSFPLVAPFLIFGSVQTGHMILHGEWLPLTLEGAREMATGKGFFQLGLDLWLDWLVGGLPVGGALGTVLGLITFQVARARGARQAPAEDDPHRNE